MMYSNLSAAVSWRGAFRKDVLDMVAEFIAANPDVTFAAVVVETSMDSWVTQQHQPVILPLPAAAGLAPEYDGAIRHGRLSYWPLTEWLSTQRATR